MTYLVAALLLLAGLYSVLIVGVTGGPNHGEHPLLVTLIHLGIFHFTSGSWPAPPAQLYSRLLMFCLAASVIGYGSSDGAGLQIRFWLARAMLFVAYLGFLFLYLSVHEVL